MAKLIVYKDNNELMTLELDPAKEYIAGRASECDILLDDVVFSRQHFKIFYAQDKWTVQSISKYSQLALNYRESDYFTLKNDDRFSTFSYVFEFKEETSTKQKPVPVIAQPYHEQKISTEEKTNTTTNPDFDDKTFVPQMTSQEWSIGVPYLLLRKEDGSTQTMRLEGDYWVLGRDESCDIMIDDPKASREHCEIYHKQKKFFIVDKKSSNGTLLNYKNIKPDKEIPLKSGDQIQIGKYLFIFEIRDPLFTEKLTNLPVDLGIDPAYANYSHEADISSQKVVKISSLDKNKKKFITIGGAVFVLFMFFMMSGQDSTQNKQLSSENGNAPKVQNIDTLSADQKNLVEKSYTLAKTLYTQGKYEVALTEIEKIHALIPEYKDSKEIAQYSKNAIDTLLEQQDMERKEREQRDLFAKVEGIVEQCGIAYNGHRNTERLQECLSPALELDPENTKAEQLMEIATQNDMKKEQIQEQRSYYLSQVAQRKRLFTQAESLKRKGQVLDALSAYNRHIASALPDPDNLEQKSKVEIKNLEQKINTDIQKLKSQAESSFSKKDYKDAISKLEQALRLNPQDMDVKDKYNSYSKELQGIVKNLYSDSVLEENLGNIESAKEKWKKIRSIDVPHGEYYKKSGLKLKKYGI